MVIFINQSLEHKLRMNTKHAIYLFPGINTIAPVFFKAQVVTMWPKQVLPNPSILIELFRDSFHVSH